MMSVNGSHDTEGNASVGPISIKFKKYNNSCKYDILCLEKVICQKKNPILSGSAAYRRKNGVSLWMYVCVGFFLNKTKKSLT